MGEQRIVITRAGGPGVLRNIPFDPEPPAAGQVAIQVRAAGINFADLFCRLGLYAAAPSLPFTPGFEVAGEIARVGDGVEGWRPGARVLAVTRFGGYTSCLNATADFVRPLPEGWSFEEGAAFPTTYLTAWHGLVQLARLQAGETVVVQSAGGGVGTAACQIARSLGARVFGTVGSTEKRDVARQAGAEEVVVSRRYRVWEEIRQLTGGDGVDVILDAVGGPGLRRGFHALRPGGRLVTYGFAEAMPRGGRRNWPLLAWRWLRTPRFHPMEMTYGNRSVLGFNLVHLFHRVEWFRELMERLEDLAASGALKPVVGATFPFERVADAHHHLQSRRSTGKVVLVRR
jgi:NADPH:quinone reductase-like Zn-dependent oxidoreductase